MYTHFWIWHTEDILTSHEPHSRECDATYPQSGWSQHGNIILSIISRKWEADLPKIIIVNRNVYKFLDIDIRKT